MVLTIIPVRSEASMRSPLRGAALAGASLAVLLPLAACGSSAGASSSGGGTVDVVASTNVWGDVVSAIGGDQVAVTSLIHDPSADPHSFEASPRTQLAVSRADLVVENGGGYDDFMKTLRSNSHTKATVIDAVDVSGKQAAAGDELNEHVWYDFPTVKAVADRIEAALAAADKAHAGTFAANNQAFQGKLDALIGQEAADKAAVAGAGIGITEPVPLYLTEAVGAVDRTPPAFSRAIEEGDDVSPAVLQQTLALYSGKQVKALVYNEQTSGPETEQVLAAAKANGIAVVPVTETLPAGQSYLSWMQANLDAVDKALTS
jgi:zinc/manganese transport system substrate-binding protein